jgi:SAM-dependent methyltransferase
MPDDNWRWDETLFAGAAPYYTRGRLPYAAGLADAIRDGLGLDGAGRLIDVGCGPGTVALRLAHLFDEVVGVDPDPGMLFEAEREAAKAGAANACWVKMRAEALPGDLGTFRVATFSRSFHWMDRDLVAAIMLAMLERDGRGAFVQITEAADGEPASPEPVMPYPALPLQAIDDLVQHYLGPDRRAGQGIRNSSPDDEAIVLERAGFPPPQVARIGEREVIERPIDDVVARVFSASSSAPHLFGARLSEFESDLRALLAAAAPTGSFAERIPNTEIRIWRTPPL